MGDHQNLLTVSLPWSLIINLENDYLFVTVACGGATHTYSESTDDSDGENRR